MKLMINDTNKDLNVSVISKAKLPYKNAQTSVSEEIEGQIASECEHNFENESDICEQIIKDLFTFLYVALIIIFIPPTSKEKKSVTEFNSN